MKYNYKCTHNRCKYQCNLCNGTTMCKHQKQKYQCKLCRGRGICIHDRQKHQCKQCGDEIDKTIKTIINCSRISDKKHNRYDVDNFIDYWTIKGLIEEHPVCYWSDCRVEMQYVKYQENLATIERLNNSIGHTKDNCVLACLRCNHMKKSNRN